MAIETFTWPTQHGDAPEITYRVRTAQFGDGYKQEAGDGPNNKEDSYPITYSGQKKPKCWRSWRSLTGTLGRRHSSGPRRLVSLVCSPAKKSRPHSDRRRGVQTHGHL